MGKGGERATRKMGARTRLELNNKKDANGMEKRSNGGCGKNKQRKID